MTYYKKCTGIPRARRRSTRREIWSGGTGTHGRNGKSIGKAILREDNNLGGSLYSDNIMEVAGAFEGNIRMLRAAAGQEILRWEGARVGRLGAIV
jgi:hypothetical protein